MLCTRVSKNNCNRNIVSRFLDVILIVVLPHKHHSQTILNFSDSFSQAINYLHTSEQVDSSF